MSKHTFVLMTADLKTVVLTHLFPFLALKDARKYDKITVKTDNHLDFASELFALMMHDELEPTFTHWEGHGP